MNNKNYILLPSDNQFISHLKESHGIEISAEDYQAIALQYNEVSQVWERRLAKDSNAVFYDIQAGRGILAVVAFAVVGFFAAPLLGIGALTGALIGASIGYRLFGGKDKKGLKGGRASNTDGNNKEQRTTQTFGFNSAPSLAPIGGIVPLVFTNKAENPNGGVRTSGSVLFSNIRTFGGVQTLYTLYGICLGEVGTINESGLLLNGQPRSNFFVDEIVTTTRPGTDTQSLISGFPYYSQCINVSNNNQLGISKKGISVGNVNNGTILGIGADDIDNFIPGEDYQSNSNSFRIISKNTSNNTLKTNRSITLPSGSNIYAVYKIKYTTYKKCTEIQLNFIANLWARDTQNTLQQHGVLFQIALNGTYIGRFLFAAKTEADVRRQIKLKNLPYQEHNILIEVLSSTTNTNGLYYVSDNQSTTTINTGISQNGNQLLIEYEAMAVPSVSAINALIIPNKTQSSNDRGANVQLSTVNEIVYPSDLGHAARSNHRGIAIGSLVALASNRLQSDPSPSWEIFSGIRGRIHLSAGVAGTSSTNTVLSDLSATFTDDGIIVGTSILRNLDKGIESVISSVTGSTIVTSRSLSWSTGDRYLVYTGRQSLCRFPDIYVWTLTSKRGGLGALLPGNQLADFFIDYPSIVNARKFCVANNFYWDGAIDDSVNWQEWASNESLGSLLFPTRSGGRFGLIPEEQRDPVCLFNASNILPDTYSEKYAPKQKLNCVHVTFTDNSDTISKDRTVSIMTQAARNGTEVLYSESLKFESLTNLNQVIRVGQVYLQSRLAQDRVVSFSTALQGFLIKEGDFIIVQHLSTEIEKECSGFVIESISYNAGVQKIILSASSSVGLDSVYSAAVYRLESGTLQNNLSCMGIKEGTPARNILQISGLTSELKTPRDEYTGDYVIVGKDTITRRTYRVQQIEPKEDGSVGITAVLWTTKILSTEGLVTIS